MKKWLLERFLPMWAKETVLRENRQLKRDNQELYQLVRQKDAYIRGLEKGLRAVGRKKRGVDLPEKEEWNAVI